MALWGCLLVLLMTVMPTRQTAVSSPYKYKRVYWLTETPSFFNEARQACAASGGVVAAIPSSETQTFIDEYLTNQTVEENSLWLGYQKPSSQWDDGSPFSWTNWGPGEPNQDSEHCTGLRTRGDWLDIPCKDLDYKLRALCQCSVNDFLFQMIPQGSSKTGDVVGDATSVRSLIECATRCMRTSECVFYHYVRLTSLCTLYGEGATQVTIDNDEEWYSL